MGRGEEKRGRLEGRKEGRKREKGKKAFDSEGEAEKCIYAPVNGKSGKGREEMREFWDEVNDCLGMFE